MSRKESGPPPPSLFAPALRRPLAARMRPRTLEEYVGQEHILGAGRALRVAIEAGSTGSILLWGPPGTGKTTLAHVISASTRRHFVPFSAVSEGVPRIRQIAAEAAERIAGGGKETILFVDEIHRLNKAQQDSLLGVVEEGMLTLIGATTETPSFEVNGALLSRTRVFVLRPLAEKDIRILLERALADRDRGLGALDLSFEEKALDRLAAEADGDARRALTALEAAAEFAGPGGRIDDEAVTEALQHRPPRFDKGGEEHFNLLSAYHKSLRASDPQAALYWMARMLEGGEDPMTLFRRGIAMAAEDIGLADPSALQFAVAARDAYHMLGIPEGHLPLAEMTIYLATAPKSNSGYLALQAAMDAARKTPAAPVPLNLRNAPTRLHRELGYHRGYRYAHDSPNAYAPQQCLPDELEGVEFYAPGPFGYEREIEKRLRWWARLRAREEGVPEDGTDEESPEVRDRKGASGASEGTSAPPDEDR